MPTNFHHRLTIVVAIALVLAGPVARAQTPVATGARRPHAATSTIPVRSPPVRQAAGHRSATAPIVGAIAGAALGGALGAALAQGACERPRCTAWRGGLAAGAVAGAAVGVLVGLAVAR